MRIWLIVCAMFALAGCATGPTETAFTMTLDRANAVGCDVKSLDWTRQRTRLECFDDFQPVRRDWRPTSGLSGLGRAG